MTSESTNKKSKKVPAGIFAASVAGAGAAGVVAGTVFSNEIKDIFDGELFEPGGSVNTDNISEINPSSIDDSLFYSGTDENSELHNFNGIGSLDFSSPDENGNIFSVSFIDINNDGEFDGWVPISNSRIS